MPHGQPDFGMYAPKVTVAGLSDMAELAARLGSIVTFDRRGDVIWLDDFQDNAAKWTASYTGGDGTWALTTEKAYTKAKSGKLTTFASQDSVAVVGRDFVFPNLSKLGFEFIVTVVPSSDPNDFIIEVFNGTTLVKWQIRYSYSTSTLSLLKSDGNWVILSTSLGLGALTSGFHHLKLVIDLANGKYHRLIVDKWSFPVSDYSGQPSVSFNLALINVYFQITSVIRLGTKSYFGGFLVTQNEP